MGTGMVYWLVACAFSAAMWMLWWSNGWTGLDRSNTEIVGSEGRGREGGKEVNFILLCVSQHGEGVSMVC